MINNTFLNFTLPTVASSTYPNAEAHREVKNIMARRERIIAYFSIDKYGCLVAKVQSKTTAKFNYQLNENALKWLLDYLTDGKADDVNVDPSNPIKCEETSQDAIRKSLLQEFIRAKLGRQYETIPAFQSPGRLITSVKFNYGTIAFYTERDEEIEEFMREHNLIS